MGATTTTSWPDRAAMSARAAMPGARTPSSLVTRMRTAPPCHAGGHARARTESRAAKRKLRLPYRCSSKTLPTKNPMPKPLPVPHPPSGDQHVIGYGHQQAVVTEVGGGLRSYTVGDDGVLDGFEASEMCGGGRGQVLAPWPNRLGDGLYSFDDIQGHAALDEPDRRNAIH